MLLPVCLTALCEILDLLSDTCLQDKDSSWKRWFGKCIQLQAEGLIGFTEASWSRDVDIADATTWRPGEVHAGSTDNISNHLHASEMLRSRVKCYVFRKNTFN